MTRHAYDAKSAAGQRLDPAPTALSGRASESSVNQSTAIADPKVAEALQRLSKSVQRALERVERGRADGAP